MFCGRIKGVQRVYRGFQVYSKGLQEYFDNMSSIFHGCFIGDKGVFQGCHKDVAFLGAKSPLELTWVTK